MGAPREKIRGSATIADTVLLMAEGNPGAIRVLTLLMKADPLAMLVLDDMNMRGSQIWVAYSDHCEHDIDRLRAALRDRDPELVATVNAECLDQVAVTSGASFDR